MSRIHQSPAPRLAVSPVRGDAVWPSLTPAPLLATLAVVALAGRPLIAQTAPITLEPLEPVGCLACEGPASFGSIRAVAITADGGVVVADRDAPMLRVFDGAGRPVRSFGRHGEGPGEFRSVSGLVALPDGGLLVSDMMVARLTAFGPDGEVRATTRQDGATMRLRADPTGRHISAQQAQWSTMSAAVHLVDPLGESVSTPVPTTVDRYLDKEGRPVSPGLLNVGVHPDGHVGVAVSHVYEIFVLDPSGEVVQTIARDIPRTARTAEEIDALRRARPGAAATEAVAAGGSASDVPRGGRQVDPLRPHFPLDALAWDEAGRLWVRTSRGGPDRTIFDVFGAEGEFLGELSVDVALREWTVGRGRLVGVVADPELGFHSVARWRIVG